MLGKPSKIFNRPAEKKVGDFGKCLENAHEQVVVACLWKTA